MEVFAASALKADAANNDLDRVASTSDRTESSMPICSPGMEAGDRREPYDVLLVKQDGTTEVYANH